jgi:chemotaxis protein CheC
MELTTVQKDALTELINIGFGRVAGALSELTGHRVTLEVPHITMHPLDEVSRELTRMVHGPVVSVDQAFSGAISGNAMLIMDEHSALVLTQLLGDDRVLPGEFDQGAQETITEVGNILLNVCLGVFGNLLQVKVNFAVPRVQMQGVDGILKPPLTEAEKLQYGLMFHTNFHLRDSNVAGYLIIILGIVSLDRMLREVDNWEVRQIS